jgi:hypothetical protein
VLCPVWVVELSGPVQLDLFSVVDEVISPGDQPGWEPERDRAIEVIKAWGPDLDKLARLDLELAAVEARTVARQAMLDAGRGTHLVMVEAARQVSDLWLPVLARQSDEWILEFGRWCATRVASRADGVLFQLTAPKVSTVNTMLALGAGVACLRLGDGGDGPWVEQPILGLPLWGRRIRSAPVFRRSVRPPRIRWCDRLPSGGRPPGSAGGPFELGQRIGQWYWDAATGSRWTCGHGEPHADQGRCRHDRDGGCCGCCAKAGS